MPEWHHVLQEEATPGDAPTFAPVGLPTLESIFTRSGKLKGNAFRSAPRLRVVLAALVSISAVVFLVFFCSRVYGRRALQEFGGRGLASSEDSDEEVDVCGFSSDEEEQQPHVRPRVSLPAAEEQHLPLKKRLLSRAGETVPRGVEPPPQQQEQQQQDDEVVAPLLRSSPLEAPSGPEQLGPSSYPAPTPLSSAQVRTLPDLDAAAGQLTPWPLQHAAGRPDTGAVPSILVELWDLQRQMGQLQQQVHLLQMQQWQQLGPPREWRHPQQQQEHFKHQHKQRDPYQGPQHLFWEQSHQQEYWFQPQQQQPVQLQQPVLQEQMQQQVQQHSMQDREQEQLFEVQELQQVTPDYGEQQAMQEEERQGPQHEEREQQRHQLKRKREEQEEPDPWEEEQQQVLWPVDPLAGQWMIDEWIEPDLTSREVPQPSTSQEALQPPAAPAAPGPWRSEYFRRQVMAGLPLAAPYASGATRSQASRDEDAAASGAHVAAASAAAALPSAGAPFGAPAPTGDVARKGAPTLISLLARPRTEGVRTASDARRGGAPAVGLAAVAVGGTKAAAGGTKAADGGTKTGAGGSKETAGGSKAVASASKAAAGETKAAAGGAKAVAGGSKAAAGETKAAAGGAKAVAGGSKEAAGETKEAAGGTKAVAGGSKAAAGTSKAAAGGTKAAAGGTPGVAGKAPAVAGETAAAAGETAGAAGKAPAVAGETAAAAGEAAAAAGKTAAAAGETAAAAGEPAAAAGKTPAAAGETGETAAGGEAGTSTTTSAASPLLGTPSTSLSAMLQHPFVRLPEAVLDASPSPISVDLRHALMVPFGTRRSVPLLQRAHALLSQDVLVDDQLKELAYVAEDMVAHLVRFEGQDLSQHPTYRAVVRLGIRFLLLDAVVCTLLLLKQTPDENEWRPIADAISHALPDPCIMPNFTERTHFSLSLGQELSNAIQILKTGKRPDPTRLLRIKRMMFCFTWSPARFRHKEFDAWRRQCKGGT